VVCFVNRWFLIFAPAIASLCLMGGALPVVQAETLPAIHSSEAELLADARDGELQLDLIEAALISSGVTDRSERARLLRVRDAHYAEIDLTAIARLPLRKRAPALLAGLHREILRGKFRPTATLIQDTLTGGDFNCVTATILFHDLCQRCNVPVEIVAQSGHVTSRLKTIPQEEIETTRPDWFTRPEADVVIRSAAPSSSETKRVISPTELLGRVYYNRALAALEQKQFAKAIELLQLSLALDPRDHDARENLLAGLNNWALALCDSRDYLAAAECISRGLQLQASHAQLRSNDLHVHQKWVAHLCEQQDFSQAIEILEAGRSRRPEAALFSAGQRAVYEAWLKRCISSGDATTAAKILRESHQKFGPQAKLTLEARPAVRTRQP
jgi:hypothetical protein